MALILKVDDPEKLLAALKSKIDDNSIDTWSYDGDGDFTHIASQWKNKAWFHPYFKPTDIREDLNFGLIGRREERMSKVLYGVYHGRFVEMLLTHFDDFIKDITVTPVGMEPWDNFK